MSFAKGEKLVLESIAGDFPAVVVAHVKTNRCGCGSDLYRCKIDVGNGAIQCRDTCEKMLSRLN